MFNEVLKLVTFKILNKLLGNCKLFGIDKYFQACYLRMQKAREIWTE